MKKFLAMVIVICVFLCGALFCGCEKLSYNNFPNSMWETYRQLTEKADTALHNSNINDVAAFERETSLLAYTVDKNVPFEVTFLYRDYARDDVTVLPAINCRASVLDEYRYREMFKANLTLRILDVLSESKISDDGDIVGMIVHWERESFFGKKSYYSICDFDGDGVWDYRVRDIDKYDSMYYTELTSSSSDSDSPVRVFDDYNIIGLSAGILRANKMMFAMTDLSGEETFKDLEKLFKADTKPA